MLQAVPSSPATLWPSSLFQFSAACKNPFSTSVSFLGSRERLFMQTRIGKDSFLSLQGQNCKFGMVWSSVLSNDPLSAEHPCWALQSQHSSARDVCAHGWQMQGSRRNRVAWVCVWVRFARGLAPHLSLEPSLSFFLVFVFFGTTGLAFCAVQSARDCLKIQLPGVACVAKYGWLKTNSVCAG